MQAVEIRTSVRTGKLIVALTLAAPCGCALQKRCEAAPREPARGLVGHWTFDDGKGAVARDASGRGNDGAVKGGAKWTKGVIGGALEFDGRDDFVAIPNEEAFDIAGNVTVSAWIRVESFTKSWQAIVTKGDRSWRLHRAGATRSVGFACTDLSRNEIGDLFGERNVADGHWRHVAGVLDKNKIAIYVDGALDASAESSPKITVNGYSVLIGANDQSKGRLFKGLIDDVRIYDRALSVDEIRALVKAGGVEAPPAGKAVTAVQKPAAAVPASPPPSLPGEFKEIFDGRTLKGWSALDMSYWSVRDGAITGESSAGHPCTKNQFIVWQGGDVSDFELKLKFRVQGNGCNSGVQFRSQMRDDGLAIGYQADIYQSGGYLGGVCDELHKRDGPELLSANGSKTVIDKDGTRTRTPITSKATFKKWPEWNDYHIIAVGRKVVLRINGVTASEMIDNEEAHLDLEGILGLQLRAGKPMTAQFKDVYLKQ